MANHRLLFSLALVIYFLCATLHAESCTTSFEMKNDLPRGKYADVPMDVVITSVDIGITSETNKVIDHPWLKVIDHRLLKVGETLKCGVTQNAILYVGAILGNKIASVHGFDPIRDAGHETVFWLVKEDGFYFSYDNASWKKDSPWETE